MVTPARPGVLAPYSHTPISGYEILGSRRTLGVNRYLQAVDVVAALDAERRARREAERLARPDRDASVEIEAWPPRMVVRGLSQAAAVGFGVFGIWMAFK